MEYLIHYLLGLEVWKSTKKIFLNQWKHIVKMKRFDMLKCKSMYTPVETNLMLLVDTSSKLIDATLYRQIIGSVMYLVNTRTDICFSLSRYLVEPIRVQIVVAKHMMIYLKGTLDFGIFYTRYHDFRLYRYTDSD
jgi:hypothetical protein